MMTGGFHLKSAVNLSKQWGPPISINFCLLWNNDDEFRNNLQVRINSIFDLGLIEETQRLLMQGFEATYVMTKGILYRAVIDYLSGLGSIELTKLRITNEMFRNALYQKKRYLTLGGRELFFIDGLKSRDSIINDILSRYDAS